MKKMFKAIFASLAFLPTTVFATIAPPTPPSGVSNLGLIETINKVSSAILAIIGVIAVLFLIIGGFQYVTSAGNPDSVQKAKSTILYAIIGLIVAILAWSVVKFVLGNLS